MLQQSNRQADQAVLNQTVAAGDYYIGTINKGQVMRIHDLHGNQAADTLFYSAKDTQERYSAVDTIREQSNIYLGTGSKLWSNRNNLMLEIVADTCGRHDTLGGACATESNTVRYDLEKRHMHACRDSWMLAIAEHPQYNISKCDIGHNINFFMNVPVSESGKLTFEDGISGAGKYVELEAHIDTIILISNCPQLNNPCNGYNPTEIELLLWNS